MFKKFEFFIAARYLLAKKRDSFISVITGFSLIGITLGVASLIVVMSVMNGFRHEITSKIVSFDGDIAIFSYIGKQIDNYKEITQKLTKRTDLDKIFPVIEQQVLISHDNDNLGVRVKAMFHADLINKYIIANNIKFGSLDNFKDDNIIIGESLANKLGVRIDDEIKVISSKSNKTIIGFIPKFKTLKIAAIYKIGMSEYDSSVIFMPMEFARKFFKFGEGVNLIEIYSKNPEYSHITKYEISNLINNDFLVNDWQAKNASFFNALKTERVVMFIILSLIILVAAFNIISSLTMLVKDKVADIAILRTMGSNKCSIIRIFLILGMTIGFVGTIMGVIFGYLLASNIDAIKNFLESLTGTNLFNDVIYYLSKLPSKIVLMDICKVAILSFMLSILSTVYPAIRAARIDPAEALRN